MAQASSTPNRDLARSYGTPSVSHDATISTINYSQTSQYHGDPKKHAMSVAYRNKKSQQKMQSICYGDGKMPTKIAIGCFVGAVLFFIVGATIMGLYHVGRLVLGREGSFIGPIFLVIGVLLVALGAYFLYRAHIISTTERSKTKFVAKGFTGVEASNRAFTPEDGYKTHTGTHSEKAVSTINSYSFNARDATFSSLDSSHGTMNRTPGIVEYHPQGPRAAYGYPPQQGYANYAVRYEGDPPGELRRPKSHESLDSKGMIRQSLDDLYKPEDDINRGPETSSRKSSAKSGDFSEVPLGQ